MYLTTGDFESGLGEWRALNYAEDVQAQPVEGPDSAKQGRHFMRVRTTRADGSVAHDVVVPNSVVFGVTAYGGVDTPADVRVANVLVPSLQFSVWLRSASRRRHVRGVAAIWNLYSD